MKTFTTILLIIVTTIACNNPKPTSATFNIATTPWQRVVDKAKGSTVTMCMYTGSPKANKYMQQYVIPNLQKEYNITLKIVSGQGKEIVNNIMAEKESNSTKGQIDLCWINGETFFQLQQIKGLYGPYTTYLPNSKYIDYNDPIIKYDFQYEVKGYETPWSKASFIVITDSAKVKKIPVTMQDFEQYWQQYPNTFTLSLDFMGLTLLKSWLVELAGGVANLDGPFDEAKYNKYAPQLWAFINKNKKYFWKNGETFPASNVTISQMFGSGEVNFTFAFGNSDIDDKVGEGLYPYTAKGYILQAGSIHNTNYLGIPYNATHIEGALVVSNYLISPTAQLEKSNINTWGSGLVLNYEYLTKADQLAYNNLPKLKYGLPDSEIKQKSIKETHPRYMIKVDEDFRKYVIGTK